MRILFIYKYDFMEPLGIMYLSSYLRGHGHECHFLDVAFERNVPEEVRRISPDIIAYSITTGRHRFFQKLNQELKGELEFISVFGGPHCTFFPEFVSEEGVDVICRGEGELAFLELANALEKGRDITGIRNMWVKVDGEVHRNDVRPLIEDLDGLPFPDRELVNRYTPYRRMHRRYVLTVRGCPFRCSYCFNASYNELYRGKGRTVRRRSVDNVITELDHIARELAPRIIIFPDDTFNLDDGWLLEFCDAYGREITIPFSVNVRIDLVNERAVKALKGAGCSSVRFAIESGNEHIRNDILRRSISEVQILKANELIKKHGINTFIYNMIGLPDESLDMAFETMDLNVRCRPTYPWASLYQPYPGTALCEYSSQKGYFQGDIDSFDESYFQRSIMRMRDIEKMERLHHLFSLGVALPGATPLIRVLIELPLDRPYFALWYLHRVWCYYNGIDWLGPSDLLNWEAWS